VARLTPSNAILRRFLDGQLSAHVALMRLLTAEPFEFVERELASLAASSPTPRAQELVALFRDNRERCAALASAFAEQPDFDPAAESEEGRVAHFAALFDDLVRQSPAASVAAYSLGREDVLAEATAEIVDLLARWRLIAEERDVLQIGCGIGRIEAAIAPLVRSATGIDISPAMVAAATERCAGLSNVRFLLASGRDLSQFVDGSFHLVYAVDSFPYIVGVGMTLAGTHFAEAARVLAPGGDFLILNFSYRESLELDREDVARLAAENGFAVLVNGEQPFRLWDGAAFHLRTHDERTTNMRAVERKNEEPLGSLERRQQAGRR
jgi:SAM-dependent methyltransferase